MLQVLQLLWNTAESKNFFGRKEFLSGTLFRRARSSAEGAASLGSVPLEVLSTFFREIAAPFCGFVR
jgi:hypothetical protein